MKIDSLNHENLIIALRCLQKRVHQDYTEANNMMPERAEYLKVQHECEQTNKEIEDCRDWIQQIDPIGQLCSYGIQGFSKENLKNQYHAQQQRLQSKLKKQKEHLALYESRMEEFHKANQTVELYRCYNKALSQYTQTRQLTENVKELTDQTAGYQGGENALRAACSLLLFVSDSLYPQNLQQMAQTLKQFPDAQTSESLTEKERTYVAAGLITACLNYIKEEAYDLKMAERYYRSMEQLPVAWETMPVIDEYFEFYYEMQRQGKASYEELQFELLQRRTAYILGNRNVLLVLDMYLKKCSKSKTPMDVTDVNLLLKGYLGEPVDRKMNGSWNSDQRNRVKEATTILRPYLRESWFAPCRETIQKQLTQYYDMAYVREIIVREMDNWIKRNSRNGFAYQGYIYDNRKKLTEAYSKLGMVQQKRDLWIQDCAFYDENGIWRAVAEEEENILPMLMKLAEEGDIGTKAERVEEVQKLKRKWKETPQKNPKAKNVLKEIAFDRMPLWLIVLTVLAPMDLGFVLIVEIILFFWVTFKKNDEIADSNYLTSFTKGNLIILLCGVIYWLTGGYSYLDIRVIIPFWQVVGEFLGRSFLGLFIRLIGTLIAYLGVLVYVVICLGNSLLNIISVLFRKGKKK